MTSEKNNIENEAVDFLDAARNHPEGAMDDAALMDKVSDLMALAQAADEMSRDDDVEQRLRMFYERRGEVRRQAGKPGYLRLWHVCAAVAACVVALVVLTVGRDGGESAADSVSAQLPVVFNIAKPASEILIKSEAGTQITNVADSGGVLDAGALPAALERLIVEVPQGEKLTVVLPDGSKVYMHAGSTLKYPVRFADSLRVVELGGRAYFSVAHNPRVPFAVKTSGMQTMVLGTEFNVVAEGTPDDNVTLVSGSVMVTANNIRKVIKPGQQLKITGGGVSVTEVDVTPYTSWRDGYIYFDDAALKEVMLDIAKEYNYNVEFCNSSMLDVRVHFVAERATGIQGIIDGLNMMNIVNIVCENRTLRVF